MSCKACGNIGFYLLAWLLYIYILVPVLFWSTQTYMDPFNFTTETMVMQNDHGSNVSRFIDTSFMRHSEVSGKDYILSSGVCGLGRVAFYFMVLLFCTYLITILFVSDGVTKILSYTSLGIVSILFILMCLTNMPLAIRSIPAFLAAGGILAIGLCTNIPQLLPK